MTFAWASILFSTNSHRLQGIALRERDDADCIPVIADLELAAIRNVAAFLDFNARAGLPARAEGLDGVVRSQQMEANAQSYDAGTIKRCTDFPNWWRTTNSSQLDANGQRQLRSRYIS